MNNAGRKIGLNIYILMQKTGMSREELAANLGYSYRDICRVIESRILLSPKEIEKVTRFFGITKQELSQSVTDTITSKFSDVNNLEKILTGGV